MARGLLTTVLVALVALGGFTATDIAADSDGIRMLARAPDALLLAGELPAGTVSNGAEPVVHVTKDGSTILVGDVSGLYRSINGGTTWSRAGDPFLPGFFADGWSIAEDDAGRIYVTTTQGQVVGVAASDDRGQSWAVVSRIVGVAGIADRPWLAARGDGEVSLIFWGNSGQECHRSVDGGFTWLDVSLNGNPSPNAGSLAYDPEGRLWFSNGATWYSWNTPCSGTWVARDHPNGGAQILTQTAVDSSGRPYTALPSGNNAQMLVHARSATGSVKTIAVSPASLQSNTFGAIAVDNVTGDVAVGWYGSTTAGNPSNSGFSGSWNVFVARVSGFWTASPTITVTQVSSVPNHVGGFCMGGIGCSTGTGDRDLLDYQGITFAPDHAIHIAYGHDGATSSASVRHARVP